MNALQASGPLPAHSAHAGAGQTDGRAPAAAVQANTADSALPAAYSSVQGDAAEQVVPSLLFHSAEGQLPTSVDAVLKDGAPVQALEAAAMLDGVLPASQEPAQGIDPEAWQALASFAPDWQAEARMPVSEAGFFTAQPQAIGIVQNPAMDFLQKTVDRAEPAAVPGARWQPAREQGAADDLALRGRHTPALSILAIDTALSNTAAAAGSVKAPESGGTALPTAPVLLGSEVALAGGGLSSATSNGAAASLVPTGASAPSDAVAKADQPILQALSQRIQLQQAQGMDVATVRLDPPQWGTLQVRIQHDASGVQVLLQASHAEVGRQLGALAEGLRQELQARTSGEASVVVAQSRHGAHAQHGGGQREAPLPWQQEEDDNIGQALGAWLTAAEVVS